MCKDYKDFFKSNCMTLGGGLSCKREGGKEICTFATQKREVYRVGGKVCRFHIYRQTNRYIWMMVTFVHKCSFIQVVKPSIWSNFIPIVVSSFMSSIHSIINFIHKNYFHPCVDLININSSMCYDPFMLSLLYHPLV